MPQNPPPSCFMARCKAVGRPTAAVSFYPTANLRKEIKVVNYIHGTGFFVFVSSDKGFGLRHVQHAELLSCFSM